MDEQHTISVKWSLKVKISLLIVTLILVVLIGNWFSFQQSKKILFKEIETRGIWIARNLAYSVGILPEDPSLLNKFVAGALHEDDVIYVVMVNQHDDIVSSTSKFPEQTFILPDALRQAPCNSPEPIVSAYIMSHQQLYDVRFPIVQNSDCRGTIHIGVSLKSLDEKLTHILLIFLLLNGFIILIGVLGYRITARLLVSPILTMAEVATRVSEGDLRQTIAITSYDEVGVLEVALSKILEASRAIAARLQKACDQIKIASDEMLKMSEAQSSVSQKQSASIYHISKTIEEIATSASVIADNADRVAKIAETTLQATQAVEATSQHTIMGMQEIQDQVEKNSERVVHLGEKISQIGNVVTMINTIADQTKLIAFNASIEAAGAGETGGRFAIVATEVRRLADTVVEALEEIRELVVSVQSAANELMLSSETGIRKVKEGVALIAEIGNTLQQMTAMVDQTTQSAKEISTSTQQQQAEHGQIVAEIKEIADGSGQAVEMSKRTTEIAKALRDLAQELDAAMQNFIT